MSDSPFDHFYADVLGEANATALLGIAAGAEGLGSEIAVLRLLLREELSKREETDVKLLQSGVRLLIQALFAQHRLTPQQAESLSESMLAFLERFGVALFAAESVDE